MTPWFTQRRRASRIGRDAHGGHFTLGFSAPNNRLIREFVSVCRLTLSVSLAINILRSR